MKEPLTVALHPNDAPAWLLLALREQFCWGCGKPGPHAEAVMHAGPGPDGEALALVVCGACDRQFMRGGKARKRLCRAIGARVVAAKRAAGA